MFKVLIVLPNRLWYNSAGIPLRIKVKKRVNMKGDKTLPWGEPVFVVIFPDFMLEFNLTNLVLFSKKCKRNKLNTLHVYELFYYDMRLLLLLVC